MSTIYADVLNVYKLYSELISASIAEGGNVRLMRTSRSSRRCAR